LLRQAKTAIQNADLMLKTRINVRVEYLVKKGPDLPDIVKKLGNLSAEERPLIGKKLILDQQRSGGWLTEFPFSRILVMRSMQVL